MRQVLQSATVNAKWDVTPVQEIKFFGSKSTKNSCCNRFLRQAAQLADVAKIYLGSGQTSRMETFSKNKIIAAWEVPKWTSGSFSNFIWHLCTSISTAVNVCNCFVIKLCKLFGTDFFPVCCLLLEIFFNLSEHRFGLGA